MRFSLRPALSSAVGAVIICVVAACAAGARNCGITGEWAGAAFTLLFFGRNAIIAFVVASFLLGGWKGTGNRLLYTFVALLIVAVAAAVILTPYQGGCTPI